MMASDILINYLLQQESAISEYQLLSWLQREHEDFFQPLGQSPSLYKRHFYLFHQLYHLRTELIAKGLHLEISALEIQILRQQTMQQALGEQDALADFYLQSDNLQLSDQEILALQQAFWQRYLALDKKAMAIKALGLEDETDLNRNLVKKRYQHLCRQHHPDKGGNPNEFMRIKEAYLCLKSLL